MLAESAPILTSLMLGSDAPRTGARAPPTLPVQTHRLDSCPLRPHCLPLCSFQEKASFHSVVQVRDTALLPMPGTSTDCGN